MKKLNLQEAPKTVAFTFGRFNPPTIGHEKLLDKVESMRADDYEIFVSHTRNPKTDPLEYSLKIAYMQKSFPKHKRNIVVSKARTIFEILVELQKQYNPIGAPLESLIMVAGSDRVKEFTELINKYNGVKSRHGYYNFKNVKVVNAGQRDPDAEGVTGMSASKMRAAAEDSDFDSFKQGTPLNDVNAKKLYFSVRRAMGIREELDLTDYEVLRDLYLSEQIWNVGELIRVKGSKDSTYNTYEIIRRGTNYVSVIDESRKVRKFWLHDIEIDDVASRLENIKKGFTKDPLVVKELEKTKEETELDLNIRDTLIETSNKSGVPYDILRKVHQNKKLSELEIKIAREEIKEYWLIGTEEYDEYLKKLTPGEETNNWNEIEEDAEYAGRTVKLNNPTKGDTKKFKVYVRNDKGNIVKVEFGDPNMEIKRDDPKRLKAFRARFGCDKDPGPKWKAKYWACKFWEKGKTVTDLMKG